MSDNHFEFVSNVAKTARVRYLGWKVCLIVGQPILRTLTAQKVSREMLIKILKIYFHK